MHRLIPEGAKTPVPGTQCQEANLLSRAIYMQCLQPAVVFVTNRGETFAMCAPCADHNVRNRGARFSFEPGRGVRAWAEVFREQRPTRAAQYIADDLQALDRQVIAGELAQALDGWVLEFLRRAEARIGNELPSRLPFDPVGARGVVKWLRAMVPGGEVLPAEPKS